MVILQQKQCSHQNFEIFYSQQMISFVPCTVSCTISFDGYWIPTKLGAIYYYFRSIPIFMIMFFYIREQYHFLFVWKEKDGKCDIAFRRRNQNNAILFEMKLNSKQNSTAACFFIDYATITISNGNVCNRDTYS